MTRAGAAIVAASVAFGGAGCFGGDPAPVAPAAPTREAIAKVERPRVLGSMPFDYASLPIIDVTEEADAARTRPDRLASAALDGSTPMALEVTAGELTMYAWPTAAPMPRAGTWPTCTKDNNSGSSVGRAAALVLPTRSATSAEVISAVGVIDVTACRFRAGREAHARAPAIVPGAIYAVRECVSGCRRVPSDPQRLETITLFGPPAAWITSNHPDSVELTRAKNGPFSRVSLPVARGSSTSAALLVEPNALFAFQRETSVSPGMANGRSLHELTQYTIEILWSEGDDRPLATAYIAEMPYAPEDMGDSVELPVPG